MLQVCKTMERHVADGSSVRANFAPHLPHLRRYARALTGSQRSGDAYVRMALETLLTAPEADPYAEGLPPRVALFHLFSAVTRDAVVVGPGHMPQGGMQALLLIEVEGFAHDEAAQILDLPVHDIAATVEGAKAAIFETIRSRVLIIEDEPMIAMHLQQIVEDMGHEVSGMAMTHADALKRAHEVNPELVLADIQLADGSSGLEAAQDILQSFDVPVVFITAYPERLLTGERPEPTYLVTKPFKVETVVATIGQALLTRSFKAVGL
jgi:CheY-like chemotaxis protein